MVEREVERQVVDRNEGAAARRGRGEACGTETARMEVHDRGQIQKAMRGRARTNTNQDTIQNSAL